MKLHVIEKLAEQEKSKYWLWKQMDMSYQNLNKMINNETNSIQYEVLERLCKILDCTVNELIY